MERKTTDANCKGVSKMDSQFLYLPLALPFFLLFVGLFLFVFFLLPLKLMKYAYEELGISSSNAVLLLLGSLIGSYINIPIAVISRKTVMASQMVDYFGMRYQVPAATDWGGTVLAVNVGGAVIPVIMSIYLLVKWRLWWEALLATVVVAAVCYALSSPVPGIGIAIPVFVPVIATTIVALVLSPKHAAPLAYIAGSLGTLIGADLMNFNRLAELNAPVASIGGAGTFDGIFLTGIAAVLIASIRSRRYGTPSTAS
jgi:uncharacterized membrane protein